MAKTFVLGNLACHTFGGVKVVDKRQALLVFYPIIVPLISPHLKKFANVKTETVTAT